MTTKKIFFLIIIIFIISSFIFLKTSSIFASFDSLSLVKLTYAQSSYSILANVPTDPPSLTTPIPTKNPTPIPTKNPTPTPICTPLQTVCVSTAECPEGCKACSGDGNYWYCTIASWCDWCNSSRTTPTPTPTSSCPRHNLGDANCDDKINNDDYGRWRCEFLGNGKCSDSATEKTADFNNDSKVDLIDFEIWRMNNLFNINHSINYSTNCRWCGNQCVESNSTVNVNCPDVMPPEDEECVYDSQTNRCVTRNIVIE